MITLVPPTLQTWSNPAVYWPALQEATADREPPFGVISLPALSHNAFDMLARGGGKPIRVATKSVRVRGVLDAVLALPGYAGALAYTLPEALWLAETIPDVVVAYPSVDRAAIRTLASDPQLASRVTLMIDSVDHLDLIDQVVPPGQRESIRVAIELDMAWHGRIVGRIGVFRSPVRTADDARALAEAVVSRPGFSLVGMMGYEAQIAGVGDRGTSARSAVIRRMQQNSVPELTQRRTAAVAAVREIADLEFVNGGGTGSLESSSADPSVTETAAGSGLFGPHLFDGYRHFSPAPAAAFALSVVRKPRPDIVTLLGGGWMASGPAGADRAPKVVWPEGLSTVAREGAGEVQTPLTGPAAASMRPGDRVWLRHTKAGEISEHLDSFAVVDDGAIVADLPTYRGEGKVFL